MFNDFRFNVGTVSTIVISFLLCVIIMDAAPSLINDQSLSIFKEILLGGMVGVLIAALAAYGAGLWVHHVLLPLREQKYKESLPAPRRSRKELP